jgi:predicted TIM-barrel fold metal-dependent hydrolase
MTHEHGIMGAPASRWPAGACDCHTHVFLDPAHFPFAPGRRYTPPPAPIEALLEWHARLGIQRVVVVAASVYGADNASVLHALRRLGPQRARGVATLGKSLDERALDELHAAGVRGVRVNLEIDQERDLGRATDDLLRVAERIAPRGWHVQVYANLRLLAECAQTLRSIATPIVLDHFAGWRLGVDAQDDAMAGHWGPVLGLVGSGKAWVKLSAAYRIAADGASNPTVAAIARRLIEVNPARMLWGSDWPHPDPSPRAATDGIHQPFRVDLPNVLDHLARWCGNDDALRRRVLVDNPATLYGFAG